MPRDYCPRCAAEVPMDDGVCFFGHEVGTEDVRPPRPPTDGEPASELEELAAAVATGEVEAEVSAVDSDSPELGSAVTRDVEPDPARIEDIPEPEPFRTPDVVEPADDADVDADIVHAEEAPQDEVSDASADVDVGDFEVIEPEDIEPVGAEREGLEPEEFADLGSADPDTDGVAPDVIEPVAPEPPDAEPDVVTPDIVEPDIVEPDTIEPEDTVQPEVVEPDIEEPAEPLDPEATVEPEDIEADAVEPDSLDEGDVDVDALEAAIAELERREELEDVDGDDAWDADLSAAAAEAAAEAAEGLSTDDAADAGTAWEETDEDDRGEEPAGSEVPDDEDPFASAGFDEEDGFVADFDLPEPAELDEGETLAETEEPAAEATPADATAEVAEPAEEAPAEPEDEPTTEGRMGSLLADEGAIDALLAERDLDTGLTWEVDVPAEDDAADPVSGRFEPEEFDVLEPTSDVEGAPEAWEAALDLGTDGPIEAEPAGTPTPEASEEPDAPGLVDEVAGPEDRTADHEVGSDADETATALVDEWDLDWGDEDDDREVEPEPVHETDDLAAPASDPGEAAPEDDLEPPEDDRGAPEAPSQEPAERRDGEEIDPDAFTARRRKKGGLLRRIFG